jgi:hypothetical protein
VWQVASAALILTSLAVAPAAAQIVRGTVTDRGSGAAVAGVVLSVRDDRGVTSGEALSDELGHFEIGLPAAGRFVLDAKRIGMRRVTSAPFVIGAGETRREDISLEMIPTVLASIKVTARNPCIRNPQDNSRTAALWEEARAALRATVLTSRGAGAQGTVIRFTRKLDLNTWRVLAEDRHEVPATMDRPFESRSADLLSSEGYVRESSTGTFHFYAPDADVLLSDTFLADHCFRTQGGMDEHASQLGLAFEPMPKRTVPDVRGVLWLDAKTGELRTLEFSYTWMPYDARGQDFGGTVAFFQGAGGRWIVRSWRIRAPEFGRVRGRPTDERTVVGIREEGGAVRLGDLLSATGTVQGIVRLDSLTRRPVARAIITLGGTRDSAVADDSGRFVLPFIKPGSYAVVLHHAALDSMGLEHTASTVNVSAGSTAYLELLFPTIAEFSAELCGSSVKLEREAIVRFIVIDQSTGIPLRNAAVLVSRTRPSHPEAEPAFDSLATQEGVLDSRGAYLACGLQAGDLMQIESPRGAPMRWSALVRAEAGVVGWAAVRAVPRDAKARPPQH